MKISKIPVLALAFMLSISAVSCGKSSNGSSSGTESAQPTTGKNTAAFAEMAGEYVCTSTITNIRCEGYTSKEVDERFKDSHITITADGTLKMEGSDLSLTAYRSDNAYVTYLVTVDDSGSGYDGFSFNDLYGSEDYDGPSFFNYTAQGTDQGLGELAAEDNIDMYYSPKGTNDWFFSLQFTRA